LDKDFGCSVDYDFSLLSIHEMNVKEIQAVKPPSDEIEQAEKDEQMNITTSDELVKPVQDVQFDVPPADEL